MSTSQCDEMPDHERARLEKVAHDLRSSLRAISIYAELISKEAQETIDTPDTLQGYCDAISANIEEFATRIEMITGPTNT